MNNYFIIHPRPLSVKSLDLCTNVQYDTRATYDRVTLCTENAQQPMAFPTFLCLIEIGVMVKCHPYIPTCCYEKITYIENHYTRIVAKLGEVE